MCRCVVKRTKSYLEFVFLVGLVVSKVLQQCTALSVGAVRVRICTRFVISMVLLFISNFLLARVMF